MQIRTKKIFGKILIYGVILLALIVVLLPLYWSLSTSIKPGKTILHIPIEFVPSGFTLEHYVNIFKIIPFSANFLNSAIITGGTLLISLVFGSIAAYGLSRYKFPGSSGLLGLIIGARMIPPIAFVIPLFLMISSFGLLDTHLGVILTHCSIVLPFTIWIMKGFFDELPRDFEEAALVDGCSRLGALRVALRLALPGVFVAAIFGFIESWNEFMFALTITSSPASMPATVGLVGLLQTPYQIPWGEIMAGVFLFTIPIFVLGYFAEKYMARIYVVGTVK
ncbi:Inner membrane ABC transporter permease protein YcjP [subsurface metagenome]